MNRIDRRTALKGIGTVATALAMPAIGRAQAAYPNKQITIISPAAAGSQSDVFARVIAIPLQERLKVPVVVENRGGAGSRIGTEMAAKAPASRATAVGVSVFRISSRRMRSSSGPARFQVSSHFLARPCRAARLSSSKV